MAGRSVLPTLLAAVCVAVAGVAGAEPPPCPAAGAVVDVLVNNLSDDPDVTVTLAGQLLDPGATCAGAGDTAYGAASFTCTGAGRVACGRLSGLRPGAWVNRLTTRVTGSDPQLQHQPAVFVAGAAASNVLVWTIYPRTFVVGDASETSLRTALLDQAAGYTATHPGPALVTFSADAFPGAGAPTTRIDLTGDQCPEEKPAGLCFTGSRVIVDGLDARGEPGAVTLSVGARPLSVLQLFGSDDVFRGLVFEGSRDQTLAERREQRDTVAFTAAGAQRDRIEQSIIHGPTWGDGVSADTGAGGEGDDANVLDGCEVVGARDKGVKITTGAHLTVCRSCVHDNKNGGVQSTLGGHLLAVENLIQHNVPGHADAGIFVTFECPDPTADCEETTTGMTSGNIVRFHGGRGLSTADNAAASFSDDYVADNQVIGSRVETTIYDPATAAAPDGAEPMATFRGVAFVCNRNVRVSGFCSPGTMDSSGCLTDGDCCRSPDNCCGSGCCQFPSDYGYGAAQGNATDKPPPHPDYGTAERPGRNAFAWNEVRGANLNVVVGSATAEGNQWEQCALGATCDAPAVMAHDILPQGAMVELGTPASPRAGAPVLTRVSPPRPRRGDLVRVFGDNFNAIDGTACAQATEPVSGCSAENPWVQQQNEATGANGIRITASDGQVLASLWPDAVTPTMLAFRMPFDCFAPLTLTVTKSDPDGMPLAAGILLCDPSGCVGQPPDAPCDDGNACTVGDHCSGSDACLPGRPLVCSGACLSGTCNPQQGCEPAAAGTVCRQTAGPCDVAETCDGVHGECPADVFAPATVVCRPGTRDVCDPAESCTGTSGSCPPDVVQPSTFTCRAAAGECDVAEHCTGIPSQTCPADAKTPSTTVCRVSAGGCDIAENCTGTSNFCPPDELSPAGFTCRASAGVCDVAETCSGTSPRCPADGFKPDTASCTDDDACTVGDHCSGTAAVCVAGDRAACDAPCLTGICDPQAGCLPKEGVKALTCRVLECTRPRLHRKLRALALLLDQAVDAGERPTARRVRQLTKLLARCGVSLLSP